MNRLGLIAVSALLVLMLAASTLFIVDQRQVAVVYALGEIKEVITEPGLKVKLPPPLQNVVFLDKRIQTLDSPETRPIFTAEKKSLIIDEESILGVSGSVTDRAALIGGLVPSASSASCAQWARLCQVQESCAIQAEALGGHEPGVRGKIDGWVGGAGRGAPPGAQPTPVTSALRRAPGGAGRRQDPPIREFCNALLLWCDGSRS